MYAIIGRIKHMIPKRFTMYGLEVMISQLT